MIDYIIISKVISDSEYQYLQKTLCRPQRNGVLADYTCKPFGFHSITLWRFSSGKGQKVGTINANIQADSNFLNNDTLDVPAVIKTLDVILQKYSLMDDIWRIAGMGITVNIPVGYPDLYMDFIRRSTPSPNYKMSHTQKWDMGGLPESIVEELSLSDEERISMGGTKVEKFENKTVTLLFYPADDSICMKIRLKSDAFENLMDKRNLSSYAGKTEDLVEYFIRKNIEIVTGTGDYYTISAAEDKIRSLPDISRKEKDKYLEALKGIQKYKSVDAFLCHAGNGEVKGIKNRRTAERCLQDIDIHGINTVCMSVRKAPADVVMVENLGKHMF